MKINIIILFLLSTFSLTNAQINSCFKKPLHTKHTFKHNKVDIKAEKMKPIDNQKLIEENRFTENIKNRPFKFGQSIEVNYNLKNSGSWMNISDGRIWSLKIVSGNAYTLNLQMDTIYLPSGAELLIYNSDSTFFFGPISDKDIYSKNFFATDVIIGNSIIIELFEPNNFIGMSQLTISKVVHGYINIYKTFKDAANCLNDANCPNHNWNNEINSVNRILLGSGDELCSGCLLNNTDNDFRPYIFTAFHCIDIGDPNVSCQNGGPCTLDPDENNGILEDYEIVEAERWLFRFKYYNPLPQCNNNNNTEEIINNNYAITFSRATFRAGWYNTDFAFLEMNTVPQRGERLFYSGWTRSTTAPISTVGLHHPRGDLMKFSADNHSPIQDDFDGRGNFHWRVGWDDGFTEGGSSGSPLFNPNHQVIGQLTGGPFVNCNSITREDYYGRFDLSWSGGDQDSDGIIEDNERLSNWLDPDGTIGVNGSFNGAYQPCPVNPLAFVTYPPNTPSNPVTTVTGCSITANYITVKSGANVIFDHEYSTYIGYEFTVELGGALEIK